MRRWKVADCHFDKRHLYLTWPRSICKTFIVHIPVSPPDFNRWQKLCRHIPRKPFMDSSTYVRIDLCIYSIMLSTNDITARPLRFWHTILCVSASNHLCFNNSANIQWNQAHGSKIDKGLKLGMYILVTLVNIFPPMRPFHLLHSPIASESLHLWLPKIIFLLLVLHKSLMFNHLILCSQFHILPSTPLLARNTNSVLPMVK